MTWKPTKEYYLDKIFNIERAIENNKQALEDYRAEGNQYAVECHEAYIESCKQELNKAKAKYQEFLDS